MWRSILIAEFARRSVLFYVTVVERSFMVISTKLLTHPSAPFWILIFLFLLLCLRKSLNLLFPFLEVIIRIYFSVSLRYIRFNQKICKQNLKKNKKNHPVIEAVKKSCHAVIFLPLIFTSIFVNCRISWDFHPFPFWKCGSLTAPPSKKTISDQTSADCQVFILMKLLDAVRSLLGFFWSLKEETLRITFRGFYRPPAPFVSLTSPDSSDLILEHLENPFCDCWCEIRISCLPDSPIDFLNEMMCYLLARFQWI